MKKYLTVKNAISVCMMVISAFVMAIANNTMIESANLLPGGFMGISRLTSLIARGFGVVLRPSIVLLIINIPVAVFCARHISRRFVFFSLLQIIFYDVFTAVLPEYEIFDQILLSVIFGGAIWGLGTAIALRGNGSTGGTDFIALYVAHKTGKEIWSQVFAVNIILLLIFGYLYGWDKAGYSIIFQFISTRMIETFHNRYKRVMIQVFTKSADAVVEAYIQNSLHGITRFDGVGGYTGEETTMLTAIISSYEINEMIEVIRKADPQAIINVTKSDQLVGKFQQPEI